MTTAFTVIAAVVVSVLAIALLVWLSMKLSDRKMDKKSRQAGAEGLGYGAYAAGHDVIGSGASDCGGGSD